METFLALIITLGFLLFLFSVVIDGGSNASIFNSSKIAKLNRDAGAFEIAKLDRDAGEFEEGINVFDIEERNVLDQDERVEFVGLHESALRVDPKFQRLVFGEQRSKLLKEAIERDKWEKKQRKIFDDTNEKIKLVGFHESCLRKDPNFLRLGEGKKRIKLLKQAIQKDLKDKHQKEFIEYLQDPFVVPEGMSEEEATREMIRKDAEKYKEGIYSPAAKKVPSKRGSYSYSGFSRPTSPLEPYLHRGKRGGKYYLVKSKVSGRVYRQYTK